MDVSCVSQADRVDPGGATGAGADIEAVQLLEHAELVFVRFISTTDGGRSWSATRLGLVMLAEGKAAVR